MKKATWEARSLFMNKGNKIHRKPQFSMVGNDWLTSSLFKSGYCILSLATVQWLLISFRGKGSNPYHSPQRPYRIQYCCATSPVLSPKFLTLCSFYSGCLLVSTHFKDLAPAIPLIRKNIPRYLSNPTQSFKSLLRSYPLREALLIILFITMRLTHSLSGPPVNLPCTLILFPMASINYHTLTLYHRLTL